MEQEKAINKRSILVVGYHSRVAMELLIISNRLEPIKENLVSMVELMIRLLFLRKNKNGG